MLNFAVKLPVSIFKEGKYFIAYTPALDLSTSAISYEKVKKRFSEAVNIFFEHIIKKGTLNTVLKDLGWQKVKRRWIPPTVIAQDLKEVKIPMTV